MRLPTDLDGQIPMKKVAPYAECTRSFNSKNSLIGAATWHLSRFPDHLQRISTFATPKMLTTEECAFK